MSNNWDNYQNGQPGIPNSNQQQQQAYYGLQNAPVGGYRPNQMSNAQQSAMSRQLHNQQPYGHQQQSQQQHIMNHIPNLHLHQQYQQHQQHRGPSFSFNPQASVFVPRQQSSQMVMGGGRQGYGRSCDYQQSQQQHHQQQQQNYWAQDSYQHSYGGHQPNYQMMYQQYPDDQNGIDAFAQFGQQSQQYMPSKELYDAMIDCKASSLLAEIQIGCEQLLSEGGEDDSSWNAAIRQRFEDPIMDLESKNVAVRLIFEMAYSMTPGDQFRRSDPQYMYSKLLETLVLELPNFFREVIVPVMMQFHNDRKSMENDMRVYLAIFYAELFVRLVMGSGKRFDRLGVALCEQLEDILRFTPTDDYMKAMMRVLKVSGAELDDDSQLRGRMDEILTKMGGYANGSPQLSETIKAQIHALIECRQRGWDRLPAHSEAHSLNGGGLTRASDDIDADLTEEERQFMERHIDAMELKAGDDEPDINDMMKEFGKFVREEEIYRNIAAVEELLEEATLGAAEQEELEAQKDPGADGESDDVWIMKMTEVKDPGADGSESAGDSVSEEISDIGKCTVVTEVKNSEASEKKESE